MSLSWTVRLEESGDCRCPLAILAKVASAVPAWRGGLRPRGFSGPVASLLAQLVRAPH